MKKLFTLLFVMLLSSAMLCSQTWIQKANYGGTARQLAIAAVVGNYAYVGTGDAGGTEPNSKGFWRYDAVMNSWTQLTDFPGAGRRSAFAFAIGTKVYVGTGATYNGGSSYTCYSDFWEYNTLTQMWTQKASFVGGLRRGAFGFSIGNYGYVGGGLNNSSTYMYDVWQYNPSDDTWTQKENFPGDNPFHSTTFVIGAFGYVCTGYNGSSYKNSLWQYNSTNDTWIQKTNVPYALGYASGFSINKYGFICTGWDGTDENNNLLQYDSYYDSWTQITDLTGSKRRAAVGFAINDRGYIGTGYDHTSGENLIDLWEYTPSWWGIENSLTADPNCIVYPNPANDKIVVELINPCENEIISIYSLRGQLLIQQPVDQSQSEVDISALAKGMYIIRLDHAERINVLKLVKE